jgi:tetratricopeptide (TPR) repeat protein
MADFALSWEIFMTQGKQHIAHAELEYALRAFNSALALCPSVEDSPNATSYRHQVLGMLGYTNRLFGRYEQAKDILEGALSEMGPSLERVSTSGELGIVYRHMDRFEDAKRTFEIQYETAKQLKFERAMCRAVGNMGMVNYQLSLMKGHDEALLKLAIAQLTERVQIARRIKEHDDTSSCADPSTRTRRWKQVAAWETIGLARLSLCCTANGNIREAIATALEGLNLANSYSLGDSTVLALSRFFYGRALMRDGQLRQALEQFNQHEACSPAIALCKEPSEENRQYLQELAEAGADMDLIDEQGYTALDYAVFAGDAVAEEIVLEGLRRGLYRAAENKLIERRAEARLRKGYRELFQEKLRPVLLGGRGGDRLRILRVVYADALAEDESKNRMFDGFKFMSYSDFCLCGKLPRSSDGLVQRCMAESLTTHPDIAAEFVIFFSYRWINHDQGATSPDDDKNTQYRRMIQATEEFLGLHPYVDRERLGIWMVGPKLR